LEEEILGRKRKSTKKTGGNIDLAIIILMVISILLFVLIYGEAGALGEILSPALGGIIGFIKYIIPIGMLAITFCIAKEDKNYLISKLMQYAVFLACIAGMLTIYQVSKGTINFENEFSDVLDVAYSLGEKNIGGGIVGAVISYPLVQLFGMFGSAIATIGVAFILLIFTFGIQPTEIILNIMEALEDRREERDAEYAERYERIKNRRKEREEAMSSEEKSTPVKEKGKKENSAKLRQKVQEEQYEQEDIFDPNQLTVNVANGINQAYQEKEEEEMKKPKFKIFGRGMSDSDLDLDSDTEIMDKKADKKKFNQETEEMNPNEINDYFVQAEEEKEDKTKQVLNLQHNATIIEDENYEFPPIEILKQGTPKTTKGGKKALTDTATKLQKTLYSFGVSAKVENVSVGPAITRYELKPAEGVRVSKIAKLSDDIALNLAAESIRIEAPIPGKQAVGIEIPNVEKEVVHFRDVVESKEFTSAESKLSIGLGKNIAGEVVIANIGKMPHVLIAGSTGSGKSVCINTLIASILYKAKPSEVRLLMIDPKVVELSVYNGIPHLLIPVVTDSKKAAGALAWAVQEMENRYASFAEEGVRDLKGYNEALEKKGIEGKLPQIVIIIDELADLMMVAAKEVEDAICRLAQKARAAGMHLVIATQRPSVDVITGLIKANIPSRIAFAVSSQIDSRTILDMAGAEKLLGKGDMLFYPIGANKPVRVQGAFVSDPEVESIVNFIKSSTGETKYNDDIIEQIENSNKSDREIETDNEDDDTDEYLMDAIDAVLEIGQASTSFIQRRFKVGFARAGRIIDQMEARGIIEGYAGSKPRKTLITKEQWQEQKMQAEQFFAEHGDELKN
jgi:S-DNA-T family DNA segregation ATPase FtsK/SpoIIIE